MGIVKNSPKITLNSSAVKIDFHLTTPRHVYGHLTNGFSVVQDTTKIQNAWTAKATLKLDDGFTDGADFGFIQLQRIVQTSFDYVGAQPAHGSLRLLVSEQPAMTRKLALDSKDLEVVKPWTRASTATTPRFEFIAPEVKCETGDHPAVKVLKKLGNDTTKQVNYLRRLVDKREFWTMFSVKDKNGHITHLQHFAWTVSYVATFKWKGGSIAIDDSSSSNKTFGQMKNGPPSDGTLATLLSTPIGPMANDLMDTALTNAVANGQGHNRKDFDDGTCGGTLTVPSDFFT